MAIQILLVEDDDTTRRLLATILSDAGYEVTPAPDGAAALQVLKTQAVDVVVADLRMGEIDGIEVLNAAQQRPSPPEVILMTGYGSLESAIAALRAGAFNYLLKPFASTELLDCVASAAQRRAGKQRRIAAMQVLAEDFTQQQHAGKKAATPEATPCGVSADQPASAWSTRYVQVGALSIDMLRRVAAFDNKALHLTPTEFALLAALAEAPGRVLTSLDIVRRTHGTNINEAEAQALLRAHIRNLRRKIPAAYLVTVRGAGYMLVDPEEPASGRGG